MEWLLTYSMRNHQLFSSLLMSLYKPYPTRWTCRTASINAVITNYNLLLEALVYETHRDEYGKRTAGFHALMEKFSTFFGLKLAYSIFSASEQLSTTLQSIIINIHEVKEMSITKAV